MIAPNHTITAAAAKVLILEDDALNALVLEDTLRFAGHQVVGPAATIPQAMALTSGDAIDAAILDLNIADQQSLDVARELERRQVPWAFATGHRRSEIPAEFAHVPVLEKPFSLTRLIDLVDMLLQAGRPEPTRLN